MTKFITTSWDDGHPSDQRLADLLRKYDLKGTFYIPQSNPGHRVMKENEITGIAQHFEIGGHTLRHRSLKRLPATEARQEIRGSFDWLRSLLQKDPVSFCPPFGEYSTRSIADIYAAGFRVIRTTELLSPKQGSGVIPTTVQMFDHTSLTYFKHLLKRGRLRNLGLWCGSHFAADTFRLVDHYVEFIGRHGGCLHLWGHSWEIDNNRYWNKVERIFAAISHLPGFTYVENRELEKTN
ncbi:MAG TPA: polysaccharide deacetylase family protein [Puia sp.]|jgi:peptidoglycan/xylan/chitin deacetylase (PgdA/CDA1 family)|nr:polysaccharide deacetylase family protein [Puia sp.]